MRPSPFLLVVLGGAVVFAACATTPAPGGAPSRPEPAERPIAPAKSPAAPADDATPAPPPTSIQPPPADGRPTAGRRLAWVNPSRCVSSCTLHPGEALVRVNDTGHDDARGHHQVVSAAVAALRELLAAARAAGHTLRIASAFRPYEEQVKVFRTTKEKGRAARPGHSEHQLGTTIDLRLPTTRAIEWLAAHAAAYGFVLSYPPGKQRVTGYRPEPWHVRFVGRDVAGQVAAGETLEEFFRRHPELAESGDCADCPAPASRATCGSLTVEGKCEGTVLNWCFDGARAAVDCASFDHVCGQSGAVPDCVPATIRSLDGGDGASR